MRTWEQRRCSADAGEIADCCLLIFTLGALREEAMPRMLRTAFKARQGACDPAILLISNLKNLDVLEYVWQPAGACLSYPHCNTCFAQYVEAGTLAACAMQRQWGGF